MQTLNIKIGQFIRKKRLERKLSQKDLAEQVFGYKTKPERISRIETGKVSITLTTLARIFDELKCNDEVFN